MSTFSFRTLIVFCCLSVVIPASAQKKNNHKMQRNKSAANKQIKQPRQGAYVVSPTLMQAAQEPVIPQQASFNANLKQEKKVVIVPAPPPPPGPTPNLPKREP